jgi:ADP-heptose:LPS heptosyltransferase
MGWRRFAFECYVASVRYRTPTERGLPEDPESIFILRNNDIGDLLVVTPLFEALHRRFPKAKIIAGVGDWNRPILKDNPYLVDIASVNAPWHNQRIPEQGWWPALRYIRSSPEVGGLSAANFSIGIDVLGSGFGSLLLMRAGIPFRLGVRGYAGGHSGASVAIPYNPQEHVGRMALRFAETLGATELPEVRPQLYLGEAEIRKCDVVMAPTSRDPKKGWPPEFHRKLLKGLSRREIVLLADVSDQPLCAELAAGLAHVQNLAGKLTLRQSIGWIAGSQLTICNSSMAMHAAAAFRRPCVVLLGEGISDADQHTRQWAYPETKVLGKTARRSTLYTPCEVLEMISHAAVK